MNLTAREMELAALRHQIRWAGLELQKLELRKVKTLRDLREVIGRIERLRVFVHDLEQAVNMLAEGQEKIAAGTSMPNAAIEGVSTAFLFYQTRPPKSREGDT